MYTSSKLILAIATICAVVACSNSSDNAGQTRSLSYTAVGQTLSRDYTVNNLFVDNKHVYLTLSDDMDDTFGYAKISSVAAADVPYQFTYLKLPATPSYTIIGEMVIDEERSQLYIPVAIANGANFNYTWLQYESGKTTPNDIQVGSYLVPNDLAKQFALETATFYNNSIFANYAGSVIGFNTVSGQASLRLENVLVSSQDAFSIQDKNTVIAISDDGNRIVRIDPATRAPIQLGESFSVLGEKGFEVSPHFTVNNNIVYMLAMKRSESTNLAHLALCNTPINADSKQWDCKTSETPLGNGSQIINIDSDTSSGTLYFVLQNLKQGTQLYRVN